MNGLTNNFSAFARSFFDSCLTLIYPQACQICEKSVESRDDGIVCRTCRENSAIFDGSETICEKCGKFLKSGGTRFETFCRCCDADFYDTARAVGIYQGALLKQVLYLKHTPFIPESFAELFYQAFTNSPFQTAEIIVPVPLSNARLSKRGFNQAELPAKILAKRTNLKLESENLIRTIDTPKHRAGMDRKARAESVKNVFAVRHPESFANKNILLIDDVFTSGATASNCAKILKQNGAAKVFVLTVARTV